MDQAKEDKRVEVFKYKNLEYNDSFPVVMIYTNYIDWVNILDR